MVMKMTPGSIRATKRAGFLYLLISTFAMAACAGSDGTGPDKTAGGMTAASVPASDGTVGAAASVAPAVIVTGTDGAPLAGVTVSFAVTGGGTLGTNSAKTDASGQATAISWTFGTLVGPNTVTASVNGVAPVTFTVNTKAGAAKTIEKVAGDVQSGQAGVALAIAPTVQVKDAFGNAVGNANVTFTIGLGGGILQGATTQVTDGTGKASVTWINGNAGTNTLAASSLGATAVVFNAIATGTPPVTLIKASGDNATCTVGSNSCAFTVRVQNTLGSNIANESVRWSGGQFTQTVTSGTSGLLTIGNLVAQTAPGNYSQTATLLSTNAIVTFNYTVIAVTPGQFQIDVRYVSTVTTAQRAAFDNAAARWRAAITGDIPNVNILPSDGITAGICGIPHPAIAEDVDDLLIFVELKALDGPGGLLGQAGPCFYRVSSVLPIVGTMQFDVADLANMEANGSLQSVIMHEMGHVLGIGSLWNVNQSSGFKLMTGAGGSDPFFTGATAKDYFGRVGGVVGAGNGVPIENCATGVPSGCGQGTRDSHWRESTFRTELMTGYLNAGLNPLSSVTLASLADQGYQVNLTIGDTYSLPTSATSGYSLYEMAQTIPLNEGRTPAPRPLWK